MGNAARACLTLAAVSAAYGGPDIIHEVSLEVPGGSIVALLGPNGAGKSTLINAVSGMVPVTKGRVLFGDRDLTNQAPHRIVSAGIAQVPQGRALFGYSDGLDNLRLGAHTRRDREQVEADIEEFLDAWPIARRVLHRKATLCSGGEQQVIAIGRALMSRPKALLLDEPSVGLAPILVDQLFASAREKLFAASWASHLAVLLVEQNVRKALEIADRIYVIASGRIVHEGSPAELTSHDVAAMYLRASSPAPA
jgi:branched-chain amino acid transport system ATP-binding protein